MLNRDLAKLATSAALYAIKAESPRSKTGMKLHNAVVELDIKLSATDIDGTSVLMRDVFWHLAEYEETKSKEYSAMTAEVLLQVATILVQ